MMVARSSTRTASERASTSEAGMCTARALSSSRLSTGSPAERTASMVTTRLRSGNDSRCGFTLASWRALDTITAPAREWRSMNPTSSTVEFAGIITLTRPEVRHARSTSAVSMRFSQRMATGAGRSAESSDSNARARNSTREAV